MRGLIVTLSALSLATPAMVVPASGAEARPHHYHNRGAYRHHGCRHSKGTTGMVIGGVGGALVGRSIFGHGLLGTAAGGVGGVFAGRAIDRTLTAHRRCR